MRSPTSQERVVSFSVRSANHRSTLYTSYPGCATLRWHCLAYFRNKAAFNNKALEREGSSRRACAHCTDSCLERTHRSSRKVTDTAANLTREATNSLVPVTLAVPTFADARVPCSVSLLLRPLLPRRDALHQTLSHTLSGLQAHLSILDSEIDASFSDLAWFITRLVCVDGTIALKLASALRSVAQRS